MSDTCSSCRFWVATGWDLNDEGTPTHGECRRFPPQVLVKVPLSILATVFPTSKAGCGCGEHKPALIPPPPTP